MLQQQVAGGGQQNVQSATPSTIDWVRLINDKAFLDNQVRIGGGWFSPTGLPELRSQMQPALVMSEVAASFP